MGDGDTLTVRFLALELPADAKAFAAETGFDVEAAGRFFADFDIEILHSMLRLAPHHRNPTTAMKPAGRDLWGAMGARVDDTTPPFASECQSFLRVVAASDL